MCGRKRPRPTERNSRQWPSAAAPEGYGWEPALYGKRYYGWAAEVDPFDKASTLRKHTAMGRFRHEADLRHLHLYAVRSAGICFICGISVPRLGNLAAQDVV
jgi:hypothetical protein